MSKKISKGDIYRKYVFDEMRKRAKGSTNDLDNDIDNDLENYVNNLDDHKAKRLCRKYSNYRNDYVYRFILKGPEYWIMKDVSISNIYTGKIHGEVDKKLRKLGRSLKKISKHKDIPESKEFRGRGEGNIHIRSLSIIAKKIGNDYKIIDGNHRAIQLVCHYDKKEITLIFYKK